MIFRPEQSELRLVGERKSAVGQHQKSVCAVKAKINKSAQNPNKTKMLISWADLTQATHFAEFTKFLQIHPTRARPSPCSPGAGRAPGGETIAEQHHPSQAAQGGASAARPAGGQEWAVPCLLPQFPLGESSTFFLGALTLRSVRWKLGQISDYGEGQHSWKRRVQDKLSLYH